MEVAGATAMWTRPDTGDCPVSYPASPCSIARNIFYGHFIFERT